MTSTSGTRQLRRGGRGLVENPDIVVVATGGVPNTEFLTEGSQLVNDGWDVLCGAVPSPRGQVLFYDDNGGHPGMDAAEVLARSGVETSRSLPRSGRWLQMSAA